MEATESNINKMVELAGELTFLRYSPSNPAGLIGWAKAVLPFIEDFDKAEWLVGELARTCEGFPNAVDAKEVYTSIHPPADEGPA